MASSRNFTLENPNFENKNTLRDQICKFREPFWLYIRSNIALISSLINAAGRYAATCHRGNIALKIKKDVGIKHDYTQSRVIDLKPNLNLKVCLIKSIGLKNLQGCYFESKLKPSKCTLDEVCTFTLAIRPFAR